MNLEKLKFSIHEKINIRSYFLLNRFSRPYEVNYPLWNKWNEKPYFKNNY